MPTNDAIITMDYAPAQPIPNGKKSPVIEETEMKDFHSQTRPESGFRKVSRGPAAHDRGYLDDEDALTRLGKFYAGLINSHIIIRYLFYVVPFGALIAVPIIVGETTTWGKQARIGGVELTWFFSWIEILWVSLWVSKLVTKLLPSLFQTLCGFVSAGTRKYALILKCLETPISLAIWLFVSWMTFIPIMTHTLHVHENKVHLKQWQHVLRHVFASLFVCSLILLAEKTIIQLISIDYHRTQFNQKIKESKHNVTLLSHLYHHSRRLFPVYCDEFAAHDYIINDSLVKETKPTQLMQTFGRFGMQLTSAFGDAAREITGKKLLDPNTSHDVVVKALERQDSAEALAKRLWLSFAVQGSNVLSRDDLVDVFGPQNQAEAEECFGVLDVDGNGDITLEEMVMTISQWRADRVSVVDSMHDIHYAILAVDKLLMTGVFILSCFVFAFILDRAFYKVMTSFSASLLAMSWLFTSTVGEILSSSIFLFIKHPFDVGDRIDVNGEKLIVEHISLLYTVFRRVDDRKIVEMPNQNLNSAVVSNISRSKSMKDQITIPVQFSTTAEDIALLKRELETYVQDKENSREFHNEIHVEVTGLGDLNKMELIVEFVHKSNWANETLRLTRKSKFYCALVAIIRRIPLDAPGGGGASLGDSSKPQYYVTISNEEAEANKKKFETDKEAKRMIQKDEKPQSTGLDAEKSQYVVSEEQQGHHAYGDSTSSTTGLLTATGRSLSVDLQQPQQGGRRRPSEPSHSAGRQ